MASRQDDGGPTEQDYAGADRLKALIAQRTGIAPSELQCPREKSDMTPCVARDGRLAVCSGGGTGHPAGGRALCVGCERSVAGLLVREEAKHGA